MKKITTLIIGILLVFKFEQQAQTIGGVINNYAVVTNITGAGLAVSTATAFAAGDRILLVQVKGAVIDAANTASFGNITSMGGAGTFEFLTVSAIAGNVISTTAALTHTYNFNTGSVQVVRVPRLCTPVVASPLTCPAWNLATRTGGILAFEAGTLTLNADIDVNEKGFSGGNFATSNYNCDDGNFAGVAGVGGGKKGESISTYLTGLDGLKGKQANGGGGGNTGNSGGGGGGNAGGGGFGGNQYSGCGSYDDRGIGGLSISPGLPVMFMGGGGGGGFKDNGLTASAGGNGGGIIYIKANVIIANNHTITANGGNVTVVADAEGAGGGGAGGSIFIACNTITGNLAVRTDGGFGGSSNNSVFVTDCHGTGGGGGGGVFAFSGAVMPAGVTHSALGGAAGVITNSASSCYNTTFGATAGTNGFALPGLAASVVAVNVPTLSIAQDKTVICKGEPVSFTASGAASYSWSTGSASTSIVVTPTVTRTYTLAGTGSGADGCTLFTTASVSVEACTGIDGLLAQDAFRFYPNPASGSLFVETAAAVDLTISDGLGKILLIRTLQAGENRLDLEAYPAGVYFIKAGNGSGQRVSKLIKTN